ncbi:Twinfilin-1 [Coemansia spiralis]|nr:Twinfilin-1 [Coemansia spiralis]
MAAARKRLIPPAAVLIRGAQCPRVASPALQQFLDEARAGEHQDVAVLRVQIRGDDLVETARKTGTADGDLARLEEYLDDRAALFLLRASSSSWYVVLWMPEGKVGVNSRMVYAASQPLLKEAVGEANVAGTLQFATLEEVFGNDGAAVAAAATEAAPPTAAPSAAPSTLPSVAPKPPGLQASSSFTQTAATRITTTTTTTTMRYERAESKVEGQVQQQQPARQGVFVKKADPRLAMSKSELEHVDMLQQEDEARSEQLSQAWSRLRSVPASSQPAIDAANHHASSRGIKETAAAASGGFHTVTLPLSHDATEAIGSFAANVGTTVVELQAEANKCVSSPRSFASTEDFTPNAAEPRFYVMRTPGSRIFVYSCPETSPPRLRMVYSTASASTLEQIQKLGCRITHRLSLFSPKDCTLVAVAATIRSGQAQRVCDNKSVDAVVSYVPSTPARSLPPRFSASTTRPLDAFTDEGGFRKAFSSVRPDAPAPAPFKSPILEHRPVAVPAVSAGDAVDASPNAGAAAWGLQLKSSGTASTSSVVRAVGAINSAAGAPAAILSKPARISQPSAMLFSQTRLSGEAGDDSPASGASRMSTPPSGFTGLKANGGGGGDEPESIRSSLPGLRPVAGGDLGAKSSTTAAAAGGGAKWDPWRSVSATSKISATRQDAPESSLQSSVFTKDGGVAPGTIADFMSDITYAPLQHAASSGTPKATG